MPKLEGVFVSFARKMRNRVPQDQTVWKYLGQTRQIGSRPAKPKLSLDGFLSGGFRHG
jgi:hypothetical protein